MALSAAQLLKGLEPAVRPIPIAPPHATSARATFESQSFGELLALAKSGGIDSSRDVQLGFDAQPPLEPAQLDRLAHAADQAEAAGAQQALMMIDGRSFVLDVESRTLTAEISQSTPVQAVNIDTVLFVENADSSHGAIALPPPSAGVMHPAIASKLNRQS